MGLAIHYSLYSLLFLSTLSFLFIESTPVPVPLVEDTPQSNKTDQGRQGILEIPKQAATIIRNFIDQNLHTYLNIPIPTQASQSNVPPELKDSIVGNFLLGNFYAPLPPASTSSPEAAQQTSIQPIFISNEPSYVGHSQSIEPTTVQPPPVIPSESQSTTSTTTNTPQANPSRSPEKVHVLDTDTSISGIYNSYGVQVSKNPYVPPPSLPPLSPVVSNSQETTDKPAEIKPNSVPEKVQVSESDAYLASVHNSYGVLVNSSPNEDVYWIPDATRPSIVIPIETSTTTAQTPTSELPTEESVVEGTTEEEEEEGSVE